MTGAQYPGAPGAPPPLIHTSGALPYTGLGMLGFLLVAVVIVVCGLMVRRLA